MVDTVSSIPRAAHMASTVGCNEEFKAMFPVPWGFYPTRTDLKCRMTSCPVGRFRIRRTETE